jgi:hypothetical protein
LAIKAEGTFEGASVFLVALHDAEGACGNAICASVADIGLKIDAAKLGANESASGTGFEASGDFAVLTDVGGELPGEHVGRVSTDAGNDVILDELHVTPCGMADGAGVVVGEASPVEAVFADVVPLFAADFTGLAADA